MERSQYWYIGSLQILANTYTTALTTKHGNCCFLLFNREYSIITNKDELIKENARIKQVLKVTGYQQSNISKI